MLIIAWYAPFLNLWLRVSFGGVPGAVADGMYLHSTLFTRKRTPPSAKANNAPPGWLLLNPAPQPLTEVMNWTGFGGWG